MKDHNKANNNSLYLLMENKLGALERIINTFTLRGHKIEGLIYNQSKNPNHADLKVTVSCNDQDLEKLVKILHNQIHVLEIRLLIDDKERNHACVA